MKFFILSMLICFIIVFARTISDHFIIPIFQFQGYKKQKE